VAAARETAPQAEQTAHLELIAEMTEEFADSRDFDATLRRALDRITAHIGAEGGSLFLLDPERDQLVCHASAGSVDLTGLRLGAREGIVGRTVCSNNCELVRDVRNDPAFQGKVDQQTGFTTRSILCASLSVGDRSLGAIELVNKQGADGLFDDRDRGLLRTLAAAAGLALQNARLAERLVEQERVRRELELAAEIQRNLLPARRPPPFPVAGVNLPARGVSGDFYAWLELGDGRVGFAIGDVSGKGMNAALLMAQTASAYRCLAKTGCAPGELLARINEEVCETATRGMFVTLVVGEWDARTRSVRLANAGHEPPLLRRADGGFEDFPAEAPPVGIASDIVGGAAFPEHAVAVGDGSLYLYTDGLTEGRLDGRPLGAEGVRALIAKLETLAPGERVDAIAAQVADQAERDDITLVVVEGAAAGARA
jgi:sigma-B regulation protein RsbU (phosphoserine phosphatase)